MTTQSGSARLGHEVPELDCWIAGLVTLGDWIEGVEGHGQEDCENEHRSDQQLNDKPVVYKILDRGGENIYTGVAGKGNVRDRLEDHLPGHKNAVPGAFKVQIDQQSSIRQAGRKEDGIISRSRPKYNQQGK